MNRKQFGSTTSHHPPNVTRSPTCTSLRLYGLPTKKAHLNGKTGAVGVAVVGAVVGAGGGGEPCVDVMCSRRLFLLFFSSCSSHALLVRKTRTMFHALRKNKKFREFSMHSRRPNQEALGRL